MKKEKFSLFYDNKEKKTLLLFDFSGIYLPILLTINKLFFILIQLKNYFNTIQKFIASNII